MKNLISFLSCFFMLSGLFAQTFPNGTKIALQSDIGEYVARCNGCQKAVNPSMRNTATIHVKGSSSQLPAYAIFTVKNMGNGKIALKTDTGKYLARCRGCIKRGPSDVITMHVSNPVGKSYAQFTPIKMGNGKYVFKTDIGKYIARCLNCSPGSTASNILSNHEANKNAAYAQFRVVELFRPDPGPFVNGAQIGLQSDIGKWVARCLNCQQTTSPSRFANTATIHVDGFPSSLPGYAKFTVVTMGNGKVALKADNGSYLARCRGCVKKGPTDVMMIHVKDPKGKSYAQFTPIRMSNGRYVLKTDIGKYIARCLNCSPGSTAPNILSNHEGNKNAAYAQFRVVRLDNALTKKGRNRLSKGSRKGRN